MLTLSEHYIQLLRYMGIDCDVRTLKGADNPHEDTKLLVEKLRDESNVTFLSEKASSVLTSEQFSAHFLTGYEGTQKHTLVITGPFGWDYDIIPKTWKKLSLSPLTFTHEMAYVLLLEQLYRGAKIMKGQKYHY